MVMVGDEAPAFAPKDQEGRTHELRDYAGRPVVLYFYRKDDTPGCTKEACSFRDALPKFRKDGAAVLGVSGLDVPSKAKFAAKHALNFPLLADEDHAVAETSGCLEEKEPLREVLHRRRADDLSDRPGRAGSPALG
jgi:peroxiredoxin Q/BCP